MLIFCLADSKSVLIIVVESSLSKVCIYVYYITISDIPILKFLPMSEITEVQISIHEFYLTYDEVAISIS